MELKDYGFKMAALRVAAQVSEPINQSMHSGFYYAQAEIGVFTMIDQTYPPNSRRIPQEVSCSVFLSISLLEVGFQLFGF